MRILFTFMCVLALSVMGCSDTTGDGGSGGMAGSGGSGGSGGTAGAGGAGGGGEGGSGGSAGTGGTAGSGGSAGTGGTAGSGGTGGMGGGGTGGMGGDGGTGGGMGNVFPCTEQGIRDAIAAGGGPYTFDCAGPQTVVTAAEIVIDNDVILDGEGKLTVDGDEDHRVLSISEGVKAELHGWTITNGRSQAVSREELNHGGGIANYGTLLLHDSVITNNEAAPGGICNRVACYNSGGGVFNSGNLTVVSTVVSENGGFYGAGIGNEGTMTLSESTVSNNLGGGFRRGFERWRASR